MDQHTLTTVLTGLGVLVAMASYHRAEKKDRAAQTDQLEQRLEKNLGARIDGVEQRLGARIDGLEGRIDSLDTKIDGVEQRLTTRIDGLETRFDSLEARMDAGFAEARAEHRSDMRDVRKYLHSLEERFYQFLVPRRPVPTGTDDA